MATKRKYDNSNDNSGEKEEVDTVVPAKKRQKLLTKRIVSDDDVTIETGASNQSGSGSETDDNDEKRQHSYFSDPFDRNNDRGFEFTSQLAKIGNNENELSNNTNNTNKNNKVNYKQWQKQFVYDLKTEGCVHKVAFPPTFKDTNDAIKQVLFCAVFFCFIILLFFVLFCFVSFILAPIVNILKKAK